MIEWMQNDALFRSELARGHAWEVWVSAFLRLNGLHAEVNPQRVRPDVEQRGDYADAGDLVCCGQVIEVKARNLWFTSPKDLPYHDLIVDADAKWRRKDPTPTALVCVSEHTGAMVCIGPAEIARASDWKVIRRRDHVRGISEDFRVLPRERWQSISRMVAWLRAMETK